MPHSTKQIQRDDGTCWPDFDDAVSLVGKMIFKSHLHSGQRVAKE